MIVFGYGRGEGFLQIRGGVQLEVRILERVWSGYEYIVMCYVRRKVKEGKREVREKNYVQELGGLKL